MVTNRRTILAGIGGLALTGLVARQSVAASPDARPAYLSAARADDGTYRLTMLDGTANKTVNVSLPGRGHDTAIAPDGKTAVIFARRPGTFATVLQTEHVAPTRTIDAIEGRHFYGHGTFSADGAVLYATENDFDGKRGVIGVYDATDGFVRLGEMPSFGIGPHDMMLDQSGDMLIVANGGIATHPDAPRVKLNLDTMEPSLAFIRRRDGALLAQQQLPLDEHHLSIRHLARGANGCVAVGLQSQNPMGPTTSLVGMSTGPASGLHLLEMPQDVLQRMQVYCGSVAFDASGTILAATSPRGGLAAFWNVVSGTYVGHVSLADCCGIAAMPARGGFVLTSGTGAVVEVSVRRDHVTTRPLRGPSGMHWDNHLSTML